MPLPHGVIITELEPRVDARGVFKEVFRGHWPTGIQPIQWNIVSSVANVFRGFHVHVTHCDYLLCLSGKLLLGIRDIRPASPTFGQTETLQLAPTAPIALTLPHGVAHGFYFAEPSTHMYAVSHYWNMADELGCRWDDPDIGIEGPTTSPRLSVRDESAGSFKDMTEQYLAGRAGLRAEAAA